MKHEQDNGKNSRRRFLALGLLAGANLVTNAVEARTDAIPDDPKGQKIKMLTPDGQLVEVDEAVLARARQGRKASNQEILNWSTAHQKPEEKE